eukprot:1185907-Prorocentrum_minimum.AAC.2
MQSVTKASPTLTQLNVMAPCMLGTRRSSAIPPEAVPTTPVTTVMSPNTVSTERAPSKSFCCASQRWIRTAAGPTAPSKAAAGWEQLATRNPPAPHGAGTKTLETVARVAGRSHCSRFKEQERRSVDGTRTGNMALPAVGPAFTRMPTEAVYVTYLHPRGSTRTARRSGTPHRAESLSQTARRKEIGRHTARRTCARTCACATRPVRRIACKFDSRAPPSVANGRGTTHPMMTATYTLCEATTRTSCNHCARNALPPPPLPPSNSRSSGALASLDRSTRGALRNPNTANGTCEVTPHHLFGAPVHETEGPALRFATWCARAHTCGTR